MRKYFMLAVIAVSGLNLLGGCASAPKIGSEKVIEWAEGYTKKGPSWINQTYVEQKGYLYFTGIKSSVRDKNLGLRQAKGEATKNVAEGINQKVTTEFTDSIQGSNVNKDDLGDFTRDAIGIMGNLPSLQGLQVEENYWQKVEKTIGVNEVDMLYNCYALVKLSVADYKKARDIALTDLSKKAKDSKDDKAEAIAETLMKRLAEEPAPVK